jgi:para-nitrobenzyl esterase
MPWRPAREFTNFCGEAVMENNLDHFTRLLSHGAMNRRQLLRQAAYATGGIVATGAFGGFPAILARDAMDPIVETACGKVRGFINNGIITFRGVRYGAPTAGKNRFMPPRKPAPWTGIRDATAYGFSAPQTNPAARGGSAPESPLAAILAASDGYRAAPAESEDCLFLNVWTQGLGASRKRPVMVWLHGGGFSSGSASSLLYDGTNLARRGDIVMVGVNHRLNVFGYTHFGDLGGPDFAHSGNAGQLDIVAALEWVRDNIDRFGGDPKRVMIFGESGGGAKVSMLLASPPAKGLFHAAVVESGPGVRMSERKMATEAAEILLGELGLNAGRLPEIHNLPAEKILAAYFAATAKLAGRGGGLGSGPFGPVLDPEVLPQHPFDPAATTISENVPLLIGYNLTEATAFSLGNPQLFTLDDAGMRKQIEQLVGARAEKLIQAYRAENPNMSPSELYFHLASYSMMGAGSVRIAERKATLGKAPVYCYRFDWRTPVMNGKLICPHGLEMPFVFDNIDRGGEGLTGGGIEAKRLASKVSEAWIAFAATGNPNTKRSGLPSWEPYSTARRAVMLLDNQPGIALDPRREQREIFAAV